MWNQTSIRMTWTFMLSVVAFAAPARTEELPGPSGRELVEIYNARSFGAPGSRRVGLELKNGTQTTRSFTVTNLWRQDEDGRVRMLFVLEEPQNLRGTHYLLTENAGELASMEVYLHLPTGRRRVLTIHPSHFDEGLLGSDFGYRDLRMQIPTAGFEFRLADRQEMLGRRVWAVDALPVDPITRELAWSRSRYYLSQDPPLLLGADHYKTVDGSPVLAKQMRVEGVREVDGAWSETRMVMVGSDGRSSVLTLQGFHPHTSNAEPALFEPAALPTLDETLPAELRGEGSTLKTKEAR